MSLCAGARRAPSSHETLPLAAQGHGEMFTGQRRPSRIDIVGQVSASALGTKFPLTLSARGAGSKSEEALLRDATHQAASAMSLRACFLQNKNTFSESIKSSSLRQDYSADNNASPTLCFSFYEQANYLVDETTFPSKSKELLAYDRWFIGYQRTYHRLDDILILPVMCPEEYYPDIFPGAEVGVT